MNAINSLAECSICTRCFEVAYFFVARCFVSLARAIGVSVRRAGHGFNPVFGRGRRVVEDGSIYFGVRSLFEQHGVPDIAPRRQPGTPEEWWLLLDRKKAIEHRSRVGPQSDAQQSQLRRSA